MATALDGIIALDLTQGMAGAMATMFLCDHGATVIRVEQPAGNESRTAPGYKVWDRGKRSLALDIRHDQSTFDKLIRSADVLVETFAPSSTYQTLVEDRRLASLNPRLVHCSITAYGSVGRLKDEPPIDELVMARVGILASQPSYRPGPIHVVHRVPSVGAAILAAQGIVASLLSREKTGRGRRVETSLMSGALQYSPKVLGERLKSRYFKAVPAGAGPFYSVYECADGQWLQLACIHSEFIDQAAAAMDIAHVMVDPRFGDGRFPSTEEARAELADIVGAAIKSRPYDDWTRLFDGADVPYARSCTTREALDNPQVRFNDMVVQVDDREVGVMSQMGVPIKLSETPGRVQGPRPFLSEHDDVVLASLAEAPAMTPKPVHVDPAPLGPPLKGVRVLEVANVLAGPAVGRMLSDLGADVIKLETLQGDISRAANTPGFYYLNGNKRSISVDIRSAAGKEVAQRLAAQADVLVANLRPGATDRMGLGAEALKRLNPGLIETHVTAYGWTGPYAHKPGLDPIAQAMIGLQRAQAGEGNAPVFLAWLAPTDYTAGGLGALGVLLALFVRERTGVSQRVDTNLLNSAIVVSSEEFMQYDGERARISPDKGQHGLGALHRLYETAGGWMYIVAESDEEWRSLCRAIGPSQLDADPRFLSPSLRLENDALLSSEIAGIFKTRPAAAWTEALQRAGVPCAPVVEEYDRGFFSDPHAVANEMTITHRHAKLGWLKLRRNAVMLPGATAIVERPTPLLGEHTREILDELGYSEQEMEIMYGNCVVKTEASTEVA